MRSMRFVLVFAVLLTGSVQTYPPATYAQSECSERIVIFLQGLASRSETAPQTFGDIEGAIGSYYQKAIHFNYRLGDDQPYDEVDTYQTLPRSVSALNQTVRRELERCKNAAFDLIGHSLGGAVAITLLGNQENTQLGSHIKRVITLDSPVNGSSQETVIQWLKFLDKVLEREWGIFEAGRLIDDRFGSDVVDQLTHSFEHGRGEVIAGVVSRVEGRTAIHTLASADDYIMPIKDAIVEGVEKIWSLGNFTPFDWDDIQCRSDEQLGACLGHTQILHDPQVLSYLQEILGIKEPQSSGIASSVSAIRIETLPLAQGVGNFLFTVQTPYYPLSGHVFKIVLVGKNKLGQWTTIRGPSFPRWYERTDKNGRLSLNLAPGIYFIYDSSGGGISGTQYFRGRPSSLPNRWGQQVNDLDGYAQKSEGIVFTIEAGKQTRVALTLSTLSVTALTPSGRPYQRMVYLYCQTTDDAGRKIHDEDRCPGRELAAGWPTTENNPPLVLGPGTVFVCTERLEWADWGGLVCVYDITIGVGEAKFVQITSSTG